VRVCIITPAPPHSRKGNRVTAERWARLLRQLGHRVAIRQEYQGENYDLLVALHARRSFRAIRRFRGLHPDRPLLVALTGTDVYQEIQRSPQAQKALELASRLIVLQPLAINALPEHQRHKARVIYQSVARRRFRARRSQQAFEVCVLGHLREVKDPFRTALAARLLPPELRLRVLHLGAALSDKMRRRAEREEAANPRYRWLGEQPRGRTLRTLARCRLLVLTSRLEGGANVISEALVCGVPVISSRIDGSIGLLGRDYPGYFPVGDTRALAAMLSRAETDRAFYGELQARCRRLRPLFEPSRERRTWRDLLAELSEPRPPNGRPTRGTPPDPLHSGSH
jgi:putative glycosyltransferase (TIGR04348 family)